MAEDNVVILPVITTLPIPVERVIQFIPLDLTEIVVIGYDQDGELYFASSHADGPGVLWLLEKAKQEILEIGK